MRESTQSSVFPLPHAIKQLRAFLGVTGFCTVWIPRYAAFSRYLFMILLIFPFGSYIIKALKTVSLPNKGANRTSPPEKAPRTDHSLKPFLHELL
jgi:hypothetical protein